MSDEERAGCRIVDVDAGQYARLIAATDQIKAQIGQAIDQDPAGTLTLLDQHVEALKRTDLDMAQRVMVKHYLAAVGGCWLDRIDRGREIMGENIDPDPMLPMSEVQRLMTVQVFAMRAPLLLRLLATRVRIRVSGALRAIAARLRRDGGAA